MSKQAYAAIKKRTDFDVPKLFQRMVADGVTRYGKNPSEWKKTWKKRALENPPALMLCSSSVEWWSPESIADWEPPEYWKAKHVFVPLAQNGAGDVWCWYPAKKTKDDAPIVFAPHDEDTSRVFAPHTEGFLFRHLLEAFTEIYEDDGSGFTREQRAKSALANVKTISGYLRKEWAAILKEVASRKLTAGKHSLSFISPKDATAIVKRELSFDWLDKTFKHSD